MTDYYLRYLTVDGIQILNISDFTSLEYTLKENEVGVLELALPASQFIWPPILDGRLEVYRRVGAGAYYLDGGCQWLLRDWVLQKSGLESTIALRAYHTNHLLGRRIVAYNADTSQTMKTDYIDDMMKEIVNENYLAGAVAARDISAYMTAQADLSLAPRKSKAFSRRNVLTILQELTQLSYDNGTYLVFDTVKTGDAMTEFRTYVGQRGIDRGSLSASPIYVSEDNDGLTEPTLAYQYADEINYVYAGGKGEGNLRNVQVASDAVRLAASVLNRCEYFHDARNGSDDDADLVSEAEEQVAARRPRVMFDATLHENRNLLYGIHYNFGDIIAAQYQGMTFDCHVDIVNVKVGGGEETVTAVIHGEV